MSRNGTRKCAQQFYGNLTVADQKKRGPFFKAITAGDTNAVARLLIESPSLITSVSLKGNPPLIAALHSPNPSAMMSLLIAKGADTTFSDLLGNHILMHVCTKGLAPDVIKFLRQSWSESESEISFAHEPNALQLVGTLLQHMSKVSPKEKDTVWQFLASYALK